MSKKYYGNLEITKINNSGDEELLNIAVYKHGKSISLKDSIGEITIHVSNENNEDGWVNEYRLIRNISPKSIGNYNFNLRNY